MIWTHIPLQREIIDFLMDNIKNQKLEAFKVMNRFLSIKFNGGCESSDGLMVQLTHLNGILDGKLGGYEMMVRNSNLIFIHLAKSGYMDVEKVFAQWTHDKSVFLQNAYFKLLVDVVVAIGFQDTIFFVCFCITKAFIFKSNFVAILRVLSTRFCLYCFCIM